jgi:hypothetical protein
MTDELHTQSAVHEQQVRLETMMKYAFAHAAEIRNRSNQHTKINDLSKSLCGLKRIDYILGGLALVYLCGLFL